MSSPSGESVHLGYLGRRLHGDEALDTRLSRIGGAPVWCQAPSIDASVRQPGFFTCRMCGGRLALVGQFAAGYAEVPRRVIHIFGCAGLCGSDSRSWRALRSVAPVHSAKCSHEHNKTAWTTSTRVEAPALDSWGADDEDGWGVEGDDWCAASPGFWPTADIDAELSALIAAQEHAATVGVSASAGPTTGKATTWLEAKDLGHHADSGDIEDLSHRGVCDPEVDELWPCTALEIYEEPPAEEKSGEHEKELLERYLHSEFVDEDRSDLQANGVLPTDVEKQLRVERAQMSAEMEVEDELGDSDADCDEEEESEQWLTKFQKRLARSPHQVVRYSWGGEPMWMAAPPPEVGTAGENLPRCPRCGEARSFELQLLPTLHAQQASTDLTRRPRGYPEFGGNPGSNARDKVTSPPMADSGPASEWGVVAIYTCSADCPCEDPCEELVLVQPAL